MYFSATWPDGISASHLRGVTSAPHAHADVHVAEAAGAEEQHRLEGLHAEDGGLEELDGAAIHLDQAASALAVSHGGGGLLLSEVGSEKGAGMGRGVTYTQMSTSALAWIRIREVQGGRLIVRSMARPLCRFSRTM